jgi:hypothetical protein
MLVRVALSSAHIFAWIFCFQYFTVRASTLGGALAAIALTYALAQVIAVMLAPYAASRLRSGHVWPIVFATLSLAAAFALLAASFSGLMPDIGWGIGFFALFMGVYRGLYRVPYALAKQFHPDGSAAREILLALIPAASGFFLATSTIAPMELLSLAAAFALVALIPLAGSHDLPEGFSWSYRETYHQLFAATNRSLIMPAFFSGVEAAALLLLWPLAIFMLFGWSYPLVGLAVSATAVLTLALRRTFPQYLPNISAPFSAFAIVTSWILRLGVGGPVGVVFVDTFFYSGSVMHRRGVDMLTFEQSADNHTYIDEMTALKEMAMGLGRIALCLTVALFAGILSAPALFMLAFVIAALCALTSFALARQPRRRIA